MNEAWKWQEPEQKVNILMYVLKMLDQMQRLTEIVQENMQSAQAKQRRWFDATS